jgi:hypothetical protein
LVISGFLLCERADAKSGSMIATRVAAGKRALKPARSLRDGARTGWIPDSFLRSRNDARALCAGGIDVHRRGSVFLQSKFYQSRTGSRAAKV